MCDNINNNLKTQGYFRSQEGNMEIKTGVNGGGKKNVYGIWSAFVTALNS